MGIGPSTKETSLHHFRDPLLEVVAEDTDLDLLGLIIVGTPDDNKDKMLLLDALFPPQQEFIE